MPKFKVDLKRDKETLAQIFLALSATSILSEKRLHTVLKKYPSFTGELFSKSQLLWAFRNMKPAPSSLGKEKLLTLLKMKRIRTLSGVAVVAVLTKPYPCPGKCIFCPLEEGMPKSYLSQEPGAQRAAANKFDPYLQVYNRLAALHNTGHNTDKIELIILGGSWSAYPRKYKIWFTKRCFDALNDFNAVSAKFKKQVVLETHVSLTALYKVQKVNETAHNRCVGLSIETRPDLITQQEVTFLRKLGVTKVQLGIQSLDSLVLKKNWREHTIRDTKKAFRLLRLAGFKIHAHWMPNLYGSSVEKDKLDFLKLFNNPDYMPDELKIYPCSLIAGTKLMDYYSRGLWQPYSEKALLAVLQFAFKNTPRFCRIARVIRDIPSSDIVAGNKKTNLRQLVEEKLEFGIVEIRSREVKNARFEYADLRLKITQYKTTVSTELFLEYITPEDRLAGFLRLSLPKTEPFIKELLNSAFIREVHVYGETTPLDVSCGTKAQHRGLGKKLIKQAEKLAAAAGFLKLAVIAAVGTREYYRNLGFLEGNLYQVKKLYPEKVSGYRV